MQPPRPPFRLVGVVRSRRDPDFEDLRCSDSDRQLVTDVLNSAYAEGRITIEEHDERVDLAYAAKTFRDLNALTMDLIAGQAVNPAGVQGSTDLQVTSQAGELAAPPFNGGTAIMSSLKPTMPLRFRETPMINAALGEVKLDLVGAQFTGSRITVRLQVVLSDVRIRVPEGVQVVDNVSNVLSEVKIRGTDTATGGVTLVLEGVSVLSEIQVLGPNSRPKKYERFVR